MENYYDLKATLFYEFSIFGELWGRWVKVGKLMIKRVCKVKKI